MKDKEKQEKVFDILNKFEFFQGQRAGRELWLDKPKEVQDKDISDFVRDINCIRSYLQDSVVLSREDLKHYAKDCFIGELAGYDILNGLIERAKRKEAEARKETAEKFLQLAYDRCLENSFIKKVEELAKQLGVEMKE